MDPEQPDNIMISDVVLSRTGRDQGTYFYVVDMDAQYLYLVNGKDRQMDRPKRKKRKHVEKVLRSETRVAVKLASGDKVLNGELRRDLAFLVRDMQANNLGG